MEEEESPFFIAALNVKQLMCAPSANVYIELSAYLSWRFGVLIVGVLAGS